MSMHVGFSIGLAFESAWESLDHSTKRELSLLSLDAPDSEVPSTRSQLGKIVVERTSVWERSQCALEFEESSALELEHKLQTTASQKDQGSVSPSLGQIWDSIVEGLINCLCKCRNARPCLFGIKLRGRSQLSEALPN